MAEAIPIGTPKPTSPGPNPALWAMRPLLQHTAGKTYRGRVFVEIWSRGGQVATIGGDSALARQARTALDGQVRILRDGELPFTNQPAMGGLPGVTFLGRVVVELWNTETIVGITGSDSSLMARAEQTLQDI